MEIKLSGKRVFISAGGAGMGRATVLAMHKLGAQVFTCDIDAAGLASLPDYEGAINEIEASCYYNSHPE